MVQEVEAEAEARVEAVARLKLGVPGVPTAQAVEVARWVPKPERQEPQALLVLMDAEMVAVVEAVIQVPALEEQEPLAVRLVVAEAEPVVLILVLAARLAQAQMAWHESIVGR